MAKSVVYATVGASALVIAAFLNIAYFMARGELYAFLAAHVFYVGWFCVALAAYMYMHAYEAARGYVVAIRRYFVVGGIAALISGALWVWKLSGGPIGYIGAVWGPILHFLLVAAYIIVGVGLIAVAFIRR